MASEKDLELLDQYVSNRLAPQDRTAFEKKLESDASLKNEYAIQKKVVEKIREARVKELKTMFNNVPTASLEPGGTSVITQVTLWVAVVGSLGAGLYFYLNNNDKVETKSIAKQEEVTKENPPVVEPKQAPKQESPAVAKEDETSKRPAETEQEVQPKTPNDLTTEDEPKSPAALDVFDPTTETENPSTANPDANSTREPASAKPSSIAVEIDRENKKYNFHYQFKEGKLHLFGAFEKNLYEIMEFFSDNKRTVFLFYKDSYYLLNEENDKIRPLAPINDPTLIKKLKDYRGTR